MRRKTAKKLANLGRLAGLVMCALAGLTALLWSRSPDTVVALEQRLLEVLTGDVRDRWRRAQEEPDAGAQREALARLFDDLRAVRRQDRLADVVLDSLTRLSVLAEARGDLAEATQWQRDCAAFDDHDLRIQARLGDLLCRQPQTAGEGLLLLEALARKFPANPFVVPVLAGNLALAGRPEQALQALEATTTEPQSNVWVVYWDEGTQTDVRYARIVPTAHADQLRIRFDLVDRSRFVRFVLPRFASMALDKPTLTVVAGARADVVDLLDPAVVLQQIERRKGHLDVVGHYHAQIDVPLPDLPEGTIEVTLTAGLRPRLSRLLATPAASVAMGRLHDELARRGDGVAGERLMAWREAAYEGRHMDLFWRGDREPFASERRVDARLQCPADGSLRVAFALQQPCTQLRIDLPAKAPGVEYRLHTLEIVVDGKATSLDPRTLPLLGTHDLQRQDGAFVATGDDPYFWFAAPPGRQVDSVQLVGTR